MQNPADNADSPRLDLAFLLRCLTRAGIALATVVLALALVGVAQRVGWILPADGTPGGGGSESAIAAEYTCPMHPQIRQDAPGKCPICGMALVVAGSGEGEAGSNSGKSGSSKRMTMEPSSAPKAASQDERYICPMMCTPPQSEPGKCPVCSMELVKADTSGSGGERSVVIDAASRRILGIRTAEAELRDVTRSLRVVGEIAYDQERVATIAAYVDGRIEAMYAEYTGVRVERGDPLALVYSPQLYSAQVEYLASLESSALNRLGGGANLSQVARDKLVELGMSDEQIDRVRESREAEKRLRVLSPISGTVLERHKVEGDYVKTGEPIYRVADLSTVWLQLDLYPSDAAVVRFGQPVDVEVSSLPGQVYAGRVAFVDPMVNEKTRTVPVRVEMANFDGQLKPGDYASATIQLPTQPRDVVYDPALAGKYISPMHPQVVRSQPGDCPICGMRLVPTSEYGYADEPIAGSEALAIPRSSVLSAGDHSVVYVETGPGEFELREVTISTMTDDLAVVLDGVEAGETVATDGAFLIDSQMQLAGKPSLLDPTRQQDDGASHSKEAGHAH